MVFDALHRPAVEFLLNSFDEAFRIARKIASFWNLPPDNLVRILHRAFLPAVVGMAEIDLHTKELRKLVMARKQDIIVHCEGSQFRESAFDSEECCVDVLNRSLCDSLKKGFSRLAVYDNKEDASPCFPRDDEVGFGIADLLPRIDIPRPLVDEPASLKSGSARSPAGLPASLLEPTPGFNPSAIHALYEPIDAVFGDGWQILPMAGYISRDCFGRLIVIEPRSHFLAQSIVMNDLLSLIAGILASDIRLVMGFCRIIDALYAIQP